MDEKTSRTQLKHSEAQQRATNEELEKQVAEQAVELLRINELLTREIEARTGAEEAWRAAEERLRAFLENSAVIAWLKDEEGRRVFLSPNYEKRFNIRPDWYGKTDFDIWPRQTAEQFLRYDQAVLASGKPVEREECVTEKDGSKTWWLTHKFTFRDMTGARYIGGLCVEITDRKAMEEELKHATEQLEFRVRARTEELQKAYDRLVAETKQREKVEEQLLQSQKMEAVGTLAGGIAHGFNNLLAAIMGNAELLMDDIADGNGAAIHQVEQILQASKRARDLIRQILTFSRKNDRRRSSFRLAPLIEETCKFLRGSLPSTVDMHVEINAESDTVFAEPSQIQQVIVNLATNAAYAMTEKGGTLSITMTEAIFDDNDTLPDRDMKPGHYAKLAISDTGTGIPKAIQARIFEPFFTTKEPGQGTGLGLAVVFGIVKSYDGAITLKSGPGKGSTFTVFFPLHETYSKEEQLHLASFPAGKERILLVDDESSVLEVASTMLKRLGYRVTTAQSGLQGWKKFEKDLDALDLVITDHVMPEMTGMRLAERILEARKDIPIILLTGYSETVSRERALAIGIREFLPKPIGRRELAETVRRVLNETRRE